MRHMSYFALMLALVGLLLPGAFVSAAVITQQTNNTGLVSTGANSFLFQPVGTGLTGDLTELVIWPELSSGGDLATSTVLLCYHDGSYTPPYDPSCSATSEMETISPSVTSALSYSFSSPLTLDAGNYYAIYTSWGGSGSEISFYGDTGATDTCTTAAASCTGQLYYQLLADDPPDEEATSTASTSPAESTEEDKALMLIVLVSLWVFSAVMAFATTRLFV